MANKRMWVVVLCAALCACATSGVRSKGAPQSVDAPEDPAVAAAHAGG